MEEIKGFDCNGRIIIPMLNGKPRDAGLDYLQYIF
jgi:hypothetical protein